MNGHPTPGSGAVVTRVNTMNVNTVNFMKCRQALVNLTCLIWLKPPQTCRVARLMVDFVVTLCRQPEIVGQ